MNSLIRDGKKALLGSFMTQLVGGCVYLYSNLEDYLHSYFYNKYGQSNDWPDFNFLIIGNLCQILGMLTGAVLFNTLHVNIKNLQGIAMTFMILGITFSIVAKDFLQTNMIFTTVFSYGSGINAMLSL